jgi:hypothetical protein
MKRIMWLGLILFGLFLLGSSALTHPGSAATANIYFADQTASKGTIIYADNQSFVNNLTSLAYIDDLATQRTLENRNQTRIQWLTSIGTPISYAYPLSPMDTNAFNRTQFYFYAQYTGTPKYINLSFEITTLNNGSTFNRTVSVNSNGIKYILNEGEFCKASYRYQVVSLQSGFTRFHIKLYQPRWGVIAKYDKTYYVRNAGFDLYSGFGVSGKQVSINDNIQFDESSTFDYDIFNVGGQNNISFKNCSIYVNDRSNLFSKNQWIISNGRCDNFTNVYFYSSKPNKITLFFNTNLNITSSVFYGISIFGGRFVNVNDTVFTDYGSAAGSYYFKVFTASAFKDVTFKNSRYGFYGFATAIGNWNASDLVFKNIQFIMFPQAATNKVYLINCTSNSWLIDDSYIFGQFVDPGKLVRAYTLELQVMNGTIPLSSVSVKIYDKANVLRYSGTTDASGRIPKQTLDYCIWNASYQVTPYIYSPYRINLTKTGFRSVDYTFNNSVKRNMSVGMSRNMTIPLTLYQNIVNATGTHISSLTSTGYKVWANYTGYNGLGFVEHLINATGSHAQHWTGTAWVVWNNYTGNTTPVTLHDRNVNSTGTLTKFLRSLGGWDVYANDAGNTTAVTLHEDIVDAAGTHTKVLRGFGGWDVYANYTGNAPACNSTALTLYNNIVNASGSHASSYSPITGWRVWANYTGDTTPVFLFNNFLNATGTHVKQLRTPGWYVWANVTGNASTAPGTGNGTVMLNFTGLQGYIDWTGDHVENNTNITFMVTGNMSLNGSVHVNEDAYFLSGMLSLDPAAMILSLFFGFFYIGYKSDKRSGGWFMLFSGFLLIGLGVLIYGILGYAAALVAPFAIFIMLLGIKKGLYGPEKTGEEKTVSSKTTK